MSWKGVKKQSHKAKIEAWCDEMGIENYTINSKGEIDVDGCVYLYDKNFEELPYNFGKITKYFTLDRCKNLTSLKGCPKVVVGYFCCYRCKNLDSLEGCPKEVGGYFFCGRCKREFTEKEVRSLCKTSNSINTA